MDRWDGTSGLTRGLDVLSIIGAAAFLLLPLMAVVLAGLPGMLQLPASVWPAALRSIVLALTETALTPPLALALLSRAGEQASLLGVSVSGLGR